MRGLLFLGLLLAATLGGCLGGDGGDRDGDASSSSSSQGAAPSSSAPPIPPPPGPPVVDLLRGFSFQGCTGLSLQQTVDRAALQALLPTGFRAAAGLGGDSRGTIAIDLLRCGNLTAANAVVPDTYYGQVYALIEPPADRVPGASGSGRSEYVMRTLASEDVLAALWPAAGYDTRSGPATMTIEGPAGLPLQQRGANASIDGYAATGTGNTLVSSPVTGAFARYTALNDGSVLVWTGTYAFPGGYTGSASFQIPADDPFGQFQRVPGQGLQDLALFYEGGAMEAMDLRRVFTPPA